MDANARATTPIYADVRVHLGDLDGPEGNAFVILGRVERAMRQAGIPDKERRRFREEATRDEYAHFLDTVRRWVDAQITAAIMTERL